MYHGAVHDLAQHVLDYIWQHDLLRAGDRVGVAVSGGADSVALLRLLLELRKQLGIVPSLVHFNHKLRGEESDADEQFVAGLAKRHRLPLHCESGSVREYAAEKRLSVEAAARELRYQYFTRLLESGLDQIATAHTLDDQAETVLLRLARGSGTRGLAGIYPQFSVLGSQPAEQAAHPIEHKGRVVRPLLGTRRKELEAYLRSLGQDWREDRSNRDLRYARNRVRHGILPRLERHLNPSVREALADAAEIARAEEDYWQTEIAGVLSHICPPRSRSENSLSLLIPQLRQHPLAVQRRVIRAAAETLGLRLEFRQIEEVLALAASEATCPSRAALPDGWQVAREKHELRFAPGVSGEVGDYEYRLPLPGRVEVPEIASVFEALLVSGDARQGYNAGHLFDPALLAKDLRVRNWRAGDRFWPAHTKSAKKIKDLLQEKHITGPQRKLWPVIVSGGEIVWVRGMSPPSRFQARAGSHTAVVIREQEQRPKQLDSEE